MLEAALAHAVTAETERLEGLQVIIDCRPKSA